MQRIPERRPVVDQTLLKALDIVGPFGLDYLLVLETPQGTTGNVAEKGGRFSRLNK